MNASTLLAITKGLLTLMASITKYLGDRQLLKAGEASQLAAQLKASTDALTKAHAAASALRTDLARNPSRLRDDDGFRRD